MLLDNDSLIRYMLHLGQAHMIRQSVRMLKQIHDSQFVRLTICNDLRGEAIRCHIEAVHSILHPQRTGLLGSDPSFVAHI